ncbi:MAG: TrkA family potassium uptake protein [Bacillota bacterium]|nr:TrkA family potassium uptake protein [Bacillota bacterium]
MKSFVVLGLGRFGKTILSNLYEMGHDVLGVDEDERLVQEYSNHATQTIQANITNDDFLRSIEIQNFDAVVVAVGNNMPVSIMATVLLKELGAKYIVVKAQEDLQEKILYRIGADKVILPERDIGIKVARNLADDNRFDMIEIFADHSIINISPPKSWQGKTLGELAVRAKYGVNIIAVKDADSSYEIPTASTTVNKESILTIMGANSALRRIGSIN